jgi:hypothetical protein
MEALLRATTMSIVLDALGIVSAIVALKLVRGIDRLQSDAGSPYVEAAPAGATA